MAKNRPQAKVIDFGTARKHVKPATEAKATGTSQPKPFLETWLKNHEDSQSVVQENLSLKQQKRRLEEERDSLIPSIPESTLYYTAIFFGLIITMSWLIGSLLWGKS